jgi:uncharacterized protein YndB with AHSA1/START domain
LTDNYSTKPITTNTDVRELVINRIFNAPRELVFEAWTNPIHLIQWWGPKGFTNTVHEIDVRVDGVWRYTMHGPDGVDYENKIVYLEVIKPEKLIYAHGDDSEDDPGQFEVTVTFDEQGGKTELTMRMRFKSAAESDKVVKDYGAIEGAKSTLDRLEELLAQM